MNESGTSESRTRYFLRVLRPLVWWFLFVLVLFGIRTHQRWMQKTRLYFDVTIQGKGGRYLQSLVAAGETPFGAAATFDGKPLLTGQNIPLGAHTFAITHPKTEPFSTNLFIWYGEHNFGTIDLKRAKGVLVVTADPPTPLLAIEGPEYGVTLTNSPGLSISVPTDQYTVTARYTHWNWRESVVVSANGTAPVRVVPRFGSLQLSCNQTGATYQLSATNGDLMQTGDLPATVTDLPQGSFWLVSWHHEHKRTEQVSVKAGDTNTVSVDFQYGVAVLESTPSGATVFSEDGIQRGVTPLTLSELQPGRWKFNIQLYNYEPATATLSIGGIQTNMFHTNLVSLSYSGAMRAARQFMNGGKYDEAAVSLAEALRVQPNDAAAMTLQNEATGLGAIARAEILGKQGDFIAGIKELEKALAVLPDTERAKQMLAEFKRREPEQIERMSVERLNRGKSTFDSLIKANYPDGNLFETHEIKTTKPLKEIESSLLSALEGEPLKFNVIKNGVSPDLHVIEAAQEFKTALNTSAGERKLVLVGAQIKDDETQILFKVLEYKAEAVEKFSIGNLIGTPVNVNLVPIRATGETNKLQMRLIEGVSNVTAIIQGVTGQDPTQAR